MRYKRQTLSPTQDGTDGLGTSQAEKAHPADGSETISLLATAQLESRS